MGFLHLTAGIVALISLSPVATLAQTITPAPDGTGTLIQYQGQTYRITGGTQAGANLFHSFQDFGLNAGQVAQFLSQPGIENILGRVTGGNPSVIQGILQVSGSNAHLYLMNPAGIIFGPGSSLDLSGNFTATTADRIGFEGGWFNAFGPNHYSDLSGNPQQLSFLQNQPSGIINSGDLITSGNLHISAGTVLNIGKIEGKHVILSAVPGQSLVQLAQPGMILRLEVDRSQVQGGITALDLPQLLTGAEITPPQTINPGEVMITNIVEGQTVNLMAATQVIPTDPALIRTGDGSDHNPTVVLFPENLADPWAVNMIDSRVDQAHDLLYGGKAGTISQLILPEEEGLGAINTTLERVTVPVDELNIIAEGNQGYLWLGQTWLNSENIGHYQAEIEQWGANLGTNAALLIYSCFTALGAIGEGFVNTLADLTGATVAASTNATGSANYGGDWQLEYSTGNLEIVNPFTVETLSDWDGKLATLTVTNANDAGAGSLREQIGAALAGDTVIFDIARTVTLTSGQITWATNNLTIDGNGSTVSGNNASRVFNITANVPTTFQNIRITGGNSTGNGGGIASNGAVTVINSTVSGNSADPWGGGIFSTETVTVIDSTVSGNSAFNGGGIRGNGGLVVLNSTVSSNSSVLFGGGLYTHGTITVDNSTISGNSSGGGQGGIWSAGNVTVNNSAVFGNSAVTNGGGIFSLANVTVNNSTVFGNSANGFGGGIIGVGAVTLTNSTVSGNSANSFGGGIFTETVTLTNSTIAFNTAGIIGGGLAFETNNTHTFNNSIIANNTAATGPDVGIYSGTHTFNISHSLILNSSGMDANGSAGVPTNGVNGNIVGVDPLLAPLANNGGPTQTHALLPGSPALNSGDNASTIVIVDQRGQPRIANGRVDIGAYEFVDPIPPTAPPAPPNSTEELTQGCPPYCEDKNLEKNLGIDAWLEQDVQEVLDPRIEDLEVSLNQEYADYLGLNEIPTISLSEAQSILNRIAQATGKKPALLYITFVPKGVDATPELTESLIASTQSDMLPALAQQDLDIVGATDELQLVLVTPEQEMVIKRITINRVQAMAIASRFNRTILAPKGIAI